MHRRPWVLTICLALYACDGSPPDDDDAGDDDTTSTCDDGYVDDGGDCVPEHCGTGTWGALAVGDGTVYVDATAGGGGDGSEGAPFDTLAAGLDAAAVAGGGLVAVAAGTYVENLELDESHSAIELAGRCRELVTVDGSAGEPDAAVILLAGTFPGAQDLTLSGLSVTGGPQGGIWLKNGTATVRDADLWGNQLAGIYAIASGVQLRVEDSLLRDNLAHPTLTMGSGIEILMGAEVEIVDTLVERNTEAGVSIRDSGSTVILERVTIRETQATSAGIWGEGIRIGEGAHLEATDCLLEGNREAGIKALINPILILRDVVVRGTLPAGNGEFGRGIELQDGTVLDGEGLLIEDNHGAGIMVWGAGTEAQLTGTEVRGTVPDELMGGARGVEVREGGLLHFTDGLIEGNVGAGIGVLGGSPGTISEAFLTRVDIVGNECDDTGAYGHGASIGEWGRLTITDSEILDNREVALIAKGDGAELYLDGVLVQGTRPNTAGDHGRAIDLDSGALVVATNTILEDHLETAFAAKDAGTEIRLQGVEVRGVRTGSLGGGGCGGVLYGAYLDATDVLFEDCDQIGLAVFSHESLVQLTGVTIRDIHPDPQGALGRAIVMQADGPAGGPDLEATDLLIEDNAEIGIFVSGYGTLATLEESVIRRVRRGADGTVAMGVVAQDLGSVEATDLTVEQVEGPGLFSGAGADLTCTACSLLDNRFAGAGVWDGTLELRSSTITGTTSDNNEGGGIGVYAHDRQGPPSLLLEDTTIGAHPYAAVWLTGQGAYQLLGNDLTGGLGQEPAPGVHIHGNAVFAEADIVAWDDVSGEGLKVEGNVLRDSGGAAVLLHNATALLSGNSYSGNTLDLVQQACGAHAAPTGYLEAPQHELCPPFNEVTMPIVFELYLEEVDPVF